MNTGSVSDISPVDVNEVIKLKKDGMSYRDIGAKFGTNHTKIARIIFNHELCLNIKVLLDVCLKNAPRLDMYTESELNALDKLQEYVNKSDKVK